MRILSSLLVTTIVKRMTGGPSLVRPAGGSGSPLLRMKHPIRTAHLLPGRVRFYVPALTGRTADAKRVQDTVARIQGVRSVEASAYTGSVLIHFDPARLEAEILFAALIRVLDLEQELQKTPVSFARREGKQVLKAVDQAVYDTTSGLLDLTSLAAILAGAAALNKFVLSQISLPSLAVSVFVMNRLRK